MSGNEMTYCWDSAHHYTQQRGETEFDPAIDSCGLRLPGGNDTPSSDRRERGRVRAEETRTLREPDHGRAELQQAPMGRQRRSTPGSLASSVASILCASALCPWVAALSSDVLRGSLQQRGSRAPC